MTCVGTGLSLWAALAARSAKIAAERAARRSGLLNALIQMEEARFALVQLDLAVTEKDAATVAARANQLRLLIARLPALDARGRAVKGRAEILLSLTKLSEVASRCSKQPTIKESPQLRIAIGEVQELVGLAARSIEDAVSPDTRN